MADAKYLHGTNLTHINEQRQSQQAGVPFSNSKGRGMPTNDDIRVMLTRMEGKQDLTNANLSHLSSLTDERHAIVLGEIKRLDTVDAKQGERISEVEKSITQRNGALLGMQISGKVALVLTGAVPTGLLMIALKYLFA